MDNTSYAALRSTYPDVDVDDVGFCHECHRLLPLVRVTLLVHGEPFTRSWPKHDRDDACRGYAIGLVTRGPSWISWTIRPPGVEVP